MAHLWAHHPFKAIYTLYFAPTTALYLVVLSLRYAIRPLRPLREWSYTTSLGAAVLRYFFEYLTTIRYQQPRQMVPGRCKERFALIQPPSDTKGPPFFSGVLAPKVVVPAPVGVVWHPTPVAAPGATNTGSEPSRKKVALVMAGGAFVLGWDPEDTGRAASDILTEYFGATNILYVQYRLAAPETPFPAAIQDVLTSYFYVLSLGVASEDITLVGDSAGGNLVIAFLRYLETTATHLPRPGAAMVFSPWVDVTPGAGNKYEQSAASRLDILDGQLLEWGVAAYRPTRDKLLAACGSEAETDALLRKVEPFISPLNHPFHSKTPLFIQTGAVEGFFDSIRRFAEQMIDVEGNKIHFEVSEHMPHDFFLPYPVLGTKKEVKGALETARRFFDMTV
ncbi:Alpha/Beta hydrolase protein [Hypomontagnella monticulosa]|nr:Alpha/Beta hydrolase protein [Hypomontagnella monticulosa]